MTEILDKDRKCALYTRVASSGQAVAQQREELNNLLLKRKVFQDRLLQNNRQARNLVGVLADTGREGSQTKHILAELKELQELEAQISQEMDSVDISVNQLEGRIISAEVIVDNLKAFGDVYAHQKDRLP